MMGPSLDIRCYHRCIVDGVKFYTTKRDFRCTTQNSGVMVIGESNVSGSDDNNFYDVLDEVLYVQYQVGRSVWLFKCRLYDTNNNKSQRTHVKLGYKAFNTFSFWFTEEPIILAMQAH